METAQPNRWSSATPSRGSPRKNSRWGRRLSLMSGVVLVLLVFMAFATFWFLTSPAPLLWTEPDVTQEEQDALVRRWVVFENDVNGGLATPPLQITSREFNVFVSMMPRLRSRVHGAFESDGLVCQFSMPVSASPRSRYINGITKVQVGVDHERLRLTVASCRVNGHALPQWICRQLGRSRFNPEAFWILEQSGLMRRIRCIEIQPGSIRFDPVQAQE